MIRFTNHWRPGVVENGEIRVGTESKDKKCLKKSRSREKCEGIRASTRRRRGLPKLKSGIKVPKDAESKYHEKVVVIGLDGKVDKSESYEGREQGPTELMARNRG